jgi:hypothetical protein
MSLITRSVTTASILALVACSGTGPYGGPSQPPPPANEINATPSLAFKPGEITINPGRKGRPAADHSLAAAAPD